MSAVSKVGENRKYILEFAVSGLPRMSNQLLRGHWRVKHEHTKKWKRATANAVMLNGGVPKHPLEQAKLTCIRVSSNEPDHDGLVSGFKPVIDALVEIGVLKSDKRSCIKTHYDWEKGPAKFGRIRVRVEECEL